MTARANPRRGRKQAGQQPTGGKKADRRRYLSSAKAVAWRTAVLVAIVVVWAVVTRLGWLDKLFVSSPSGVAAAAVDLARSGAAWPALSQTGQAIAIAFVAGTVSGIIGGLAIGLVPVIRRAYFPVVLFLMSTPKVVFVPLFLLVFGIGSTSVAAFGAFQAFFYVAVEVVGGIGLVQHQHLVLATAFRASWIQKLRHVILPAASPGLFSAVWFGLKQSLTGALIVELFASAGGLGQLMQQYTQDLQTAYVLALALAVAIAAILIGVAINALERRVCKWRNTGPQSQRF